MFQHIWFFLKKISNTFIGFQISYLIKSLIQILVPHNQLTSSPNRTTTIQAYDHSIPCRHLDPGRAKKLNHFTEFHGHFLKRDFMVAKRRSVTLVLVKLRGKGEFRSSMSTMMPKSPNGLKQSSIKTVVLFGELKCFRLWGASILKKI